MDSTKSKNYQQVKNIIEGLSNKELMQLKDEINLKLHISRGQRDNSTLQALLLNGPTLSEEEIQELETGRELFKNWLSE